MIRRRLAAGTLALASLMAGASLRADGPAAEARRRAAIVAHVGSAAITVGDVEAPLAAMPPFQRAVWGSTPSAIRAGFLDAILAPQALLSLAADAQSLEAAPPSTYAIERARSGATVRAIRARIGSAASISVDEVRAYYEQNRATFELAQRYRVWRILCKTREDAESVLSAIKSAPTPKIFSDLARAHSQDKATYLRGGDLGFVTAEGVSSEPGLRVDPAIMHAVEALQDGDLTTAPVAEGPYYSVVWRRGSLAANRRSLDDAAPAIRDAIWKNRVKTETDQLLASLRAAKVRDVNEGLLESADIAAVRKSDAGL